MSSGVGPSNPAFPTFTEERGTLIATELSDVPFPVKRVFVVTGPKAGAVRGNHLVSCNELLMLATGRATVWTREERNTEPVETVLTAPGSTVVLRKGIFMQYELADEHSTVVVFADEPYSKGAIQQ